MNQYIQQDEYRRDTPAETQNTRNNTSIWPLAVFAAITVILRLILARFIPGGALAMICPVISFFVTFTGIFRKRFFKTLSGSFRTERGIRVKVIAGVAQCCFGIFAATVVCGLIILIFDSFGINILLDNLRITVPLKGIDGTVFALYMCIIAPILHELVFRVFVMKSFCACNEKTSVFVSAVLYAIFHGMYITIFHGIVLGFVLGSLACSYKSVMTSVKVNIIGSVLTYGVIWSVAEEIALFYVPLIIIFSFSLF